MTGSPAGEAGGLRVALLVHEFPIYSETFVRGLASGLLDLGCDARILALDPSPKGAPEAPARLEAIARRARAPLALPGARPLPGPLARADRVLRHAALFRAAGPLDIVHAQFATAGLLALGPLRIGAWRARALVVHARGHDVTRFTEGRRGDLYVPLFGRAALVIANSAHFRARAIALGCPEAKVIVIGSPIDTGRFRPPARRAPPEGRPTRLVAVGRLVEKKGFADAIEAVARLGAEGRAVVLDILGDGPLRADLARRAAAVPGGAVRLLGTATPDGVLAALWGADIALAPSVTAAGGDQDGPVNTLKEAMATELPVVATRHGGIPELVTDGESGILVPERDPQAIARAIARLMDDAALRRRIGAAGRQKVVEIYGQGRISRDTIRAYRSALGERFDQGGFP